MRWWWLCFVVACGSVKAKDQVDAGATVDARPIDADPAAPPTVVSTTPANNATGVAPDATIVIAFSKPMDQTATQNAWTSADLPAGQVTFAWNTAGTELTVTPNQGLPVAMGTGLNPAGVTAEEIAFAITTGATDMTGQALATQLSSQFSTFRRFTHDVGIIDGLTQSVVNDGTVISPPSGAVGDSNFSNTYFRMFVSFALPMLPNGAMLRRAELRGTQESVQGTPYASFGALKTQHVNFAAFDVNTFSATPIATAADFANTAALEAKTADVTPRVIDDYANLAARGNRSQYRLEFTTGTNNDGDRDLAVFTRTAFALRLTYTVP